MADLVRLEIRAGADRYPVLVGRGAVGRLPDLLAEVGVRGRLRLVADEQVARLRGGAVEAVLGRAGREVAATTISGREQDKNLATVGRVYDWLIQVGTDRSDAVVALGGGVVGDLVGFAAATYLRGVRFVQIPTTLLAMVDASIGGKTGVDHPAGKNLIGAFYQPRLVLADLDMLDSLPARALTNGWAEVVKMGVIRSAELFERIEADPAGMLQLQTGAAWAIARSIALKGEVVAADERESDLRMILNYGHTIGHAIEAATGFERYLHGEAVAIGMTGAAAIARAMDLVPAELVDRQRRLLERLGLPVGCPGLSPAALRGPMGRDKKAVGARLRWVLPEGLGSASVRDDVPDDLVDRVLAELCTN